MAEADQPVTAAEALPEGSLAPLIEGLYHAVLGRPSDPNGLADAADFLRRRAVAEGVPALVAAMLGSAEYRARLKGSEERGEVNALVVAETGLVVQGGPFAGMRLLDRSMRGDGDIAPKLLGTYEQEVHAAIERFAGRRYDAILDIGCAEGYYAVGLARRFPDTPVLAFDTDQGALDILRRMAADNGVADRIVIGDFCDPAALIGLFGRYPRLLVVADCEGYEKTLFADPAVAAASGGADLIIECHDLWDAEITPAITAALSPTHRIEVARSGGRDPSAFPFLGHLSDWDRWRAVWERRGAVQNWLVCDARR